MSAPGLGVGPGQPLAGRTLLVTRPAGEMEALAGPLEALGASVERLPALAIVAPRDPAPLLRGARMLARFDWVVLTSPRGVRALKGALAEAGGEARPQRVAAVGSTTADACRRAGWEPDLVPGRFDAGGLLAAFDALEVPLRGCRVLLPVAEAARDVLPAGLAARGARVERVVAYRSVFPEDAPVEPIRRMLEEGLVELLTFTSPSAAANILGALGEGVRRVPAAVIGPVTARAARALGYEVAAVAEPHTVPGLVEAVVEVVGAKPR